MSTHIRSTAVLVAVLVAVVSCARFDAVELPDSGAMTSGGAPDGGGAARDAATADAPTDTGAGLCDPMLKRCSSEVLLLHESDFTGEPIKGGTGAGQLAVADDGICGSARFVASGLDSAYTVRVLPIPLASEASTIHVRQRITGPASGAGTASIGCGLFFINAVRITEDRFGVTDDGKFVIGGVTTTADGTTIVTEPKLTSFDAPSPQADVTRVFDLSVTIAVAGITTKAAIDGKSVSGPTLLHPGDNMTAQLRCGLIHHDGGSHTFKFDRVELQVCP